MKKHHEGFVGICGLFTRKDNFLTSLLRSRGGRSISPAFLSALLVLLLSLAVWGGTAAAYTEGGSNNFFGTGAGSSNSGNNNSFFGGSAGTSNTYGFSNSCFGWSAGTSNTNGCYNSFFGYEAGYLRIPVKAATIPLRIRPPIPVKAASKNEASRGEEFHSATGAAWRSSRNFFLLMDSPFSSSL